MWTRLVNWWRRRAEARRRRALGLEALDRLFLERSELLSQGRLKRHHRNRCNLLEIDLDENGAVERLLFGIIRHPKTHPLAPRGEEVLELLEYRPGEGTLQVAGSRNLTRARGDST